MTATLYITRTDETEFYASFPVGSKKDAQTALALTIEKWANEGWFIKEDGPFDVWMVRGTTDPTYHLVIG
jgi:hypothetical protein